MLENHLHFRVDPSSSFIHLHPLFFFPLPSSFFPARHDHVHNGATSRVLTRCRLSHLITTTFPDSIGPLQRLQQPIRCGAVSNFRRHQRYSGKIIVSKMLKSPVKIPLSLASCCHIRPCGPRASGRTHDLGDGIGYFS